jgi:SAM-dependent methyltransferase
MRTDLFADVPSAIDLRSMAHARDWATTAMAKRPWREEFFGQIAHELSQISAAPLSILELGSGPGFLARHVLSALPTSKYVALDFSTAMHELARQRLRGQASQVEFLEVDFRAAHWAKGLPCVDAVVTMQAVHELRHKRHAPQFYQTVRPLVTQGGILLMCDHFVGSQGMSDRMLFMTPEEHAAALRDGGFATVELLLQKGGLVLFRARGTA